MALCALLRQTIKSLEAKGTVALLFALGASESINFIPPSDLPMPALEHLEEYRVVKVVLPLQEGAQQLIMGLQRPPPRPSLKSLFCPTS